MKRKVWIVLALLLVLAACAVKPEAKDAVGQGVQVETIVDAHYNVYRITDAQENVVCYTFGEAIACVPREGR